MKKDTLKIIKVARYNPRVFRRLNILTSRDRIISHLEQKLKKHEEFNILVNSLSEEGRKELGSYVESVNYEFDKSVKKYKEMFNIE